MDREEQILQELIDTIKQIKKEKCDDISCRDCVYKKPNVDCFVNLYAIELYKAGYRKLLPYPGMGKDVVIITKEDLDKLNSYIKSEDSVVLSREEHEILVKTAQGKIGNMKATDFLKACISSGVMVEAVSTKEQVKQAVKEFASKLKDKAVDFLYSATVDGHPGFDIHISELCHMIDELLKETSND